MEDSVADIALRKERELLTVPVKVGIILAIVTWLVTKNLTQTAIIVLTHAILHVIIK